MCYRYGESEIWNSGIEHGVEKWHSEVTAAEEVNPKSARADYIQGVVGGVVVKLQARELNEYHRCRLHRADLKIEWVLHRVRILQILSRVLYP